MHELNDQAREEMSMMTHRRVPLTWLSILAIIALVALGASSALAAGPPGGLNVNVVNPPGNPVPVTIQGTVQNDVVNQPYNAVAVDTGSTGDAELILAFNVPTGQRLIVETITVKVQVGSGQSAESHFNLAGNIRGELELRPKGPGQTGADLWVATHPVTLRVNGTAASDELIIVVTRNPANGPVVAEVSVHGYLVPLP